jgi:hypothetical protein
LRAEPVVELALDLSELEALSGVGGQVAGAAVLASFDGRDLALEPFGALFAGLQLSSR